MKRAVFIGRFSPFHNGHMSMMKEKIQKGIPLLIFVRNTYYDMYPAELRKRMIEAAMIKKKVDAKVVIIDDIESVNYGRGVGYSVNEIKVPDDIEKISATEIRDKISRKDNSWKTQVPDGASQVIEKYISNKGVVIWFTGLPCSGKTTLANSLSDALLSKGVRTERLDGDIIREHLTKDLGFSKEDRIENLKRAGFLAGLLARNGVVVSAAFISPYQSIRDEIRLLIEKESHFVEVFVNAPLETCKTRDIKGMYAKAEKGIIKNFTGVDDPFENPKYPDIEVNTDKMDVEECTKKIVDYLIPILG